MTSDREEIRELLARYCFALDERRVADVAALFTAQGQWVAPSGTATGPVEIATLLDRIVPDPALGQAQQHVNTSLLITVEGSSAEVLSYYTVIRPSPAGPAIAVAGRYRDELVKVSGAWRFSRRELLHMIVRP